MGPVLSERPQILKVGGVQAANIADTNDLIHALKSRGPLSVVLSAPNTSSFRTTNVLIEAAECLACGDASGAKEKLHSVRDFVIELLKKEVICEPSYPAILNDIMCIFDTYDTMIDFYARRRSPSARLLPSPPVMDNDYVATVLRQPSHGGRSLPSVRAIIPFLELGENISAIIYTYLTGGISVTSRSWMRDDISTVRERVCDKHHLLISGALRMSPREKMLLKFGRGYTDANSGRLAARTGASLAVHKEYPVCSADPRIVNGASQKIRQASMSTIQSSLHPLVRAQFLNHHIFGEGEPHNIQVGIIGTDDVTDIIRGDIETSAPLIQKGPQIASPMLNEGQLTEQLGGDLPENHCFVSILDHFPNAQRRAEQIGKILGRDAIVVQLDERTTSVLVPCLEGDDMVRRLHSLLVNP